MKSLEFVEQHGNTLKPHHLEQLKSFKDETMENIWENSNDPIFLIEIFRCVFNPNYDTALNEYLRDSIQLFSSFCENEIFLHPMKRSVELIQSLIDAKISKEEFHYECAMIHKESIALKDAGTENERAAIYAASFAISWLEKSSIFAAYHATEHLLRSFGEGQEELSNKIRHYVGNPFH